MKKCKSCQSEIDAKAKKCPHCQADQRNWFIRHPILTVLLVFFILGIIGAAGGKQSGKTPTYKVSESSDKTLSEAVSEKVELPTLTPIPSPTAIVINPINISGTGQQASSKFQLEKGLSIFKMTNNGSSNFSIWLMDDEGNRVELLVNEIGDFEGSKAVSISKNGEYVLDISSSGTWNITIEQPRKQSAPATNSFEGITQKATELFYSKKGLKTVKMTHDGKRNFAVWLLDSMGDRVELLVNEIGSFDGSKAVRIPTDGIYLFDIAADGNWTVVLE